MKSTATAVWQGALKDGTGKISAAGGAFTDTPYNYGKRFEGATGPGTTPEELIAAAHASCFSMALSAELGKAGFTPHQIRTEAVVTLKPVDGKPTVTGSHLTTRVRIDGIDDAKFQEIAAGAKAGCPISRLLDTEITLDAALTDEAA
ncbi:MAG: OsmC family protein [Myxococcales bacterium]|nr:OsmC family protein [Myxococcales bacterium]MCB9736926.1 OsmC family protein [Deltaproteobacteria bacterium]